MESQLSSGYRLPLHTNLTACLNTVGCLEGGLALGRLELCVMFSQSHTFRVETPSSSLSQIMCGDILSYRNNLAIIRSFLVKVVRRALSSLRKWLSSTPF